MGLLIRLIILAVLAFLWFRQSKHHSRRQREASHGDGHGISRYERERWSERNQHGGHH